MEYGTVLDTDELQQVNPIAFMFVLVQDGNRTFRFDDRDTTTPVGPEVFASPFMQGRWKLHS